MAHEALCQGIPASRFLLQHRQRSYSRVMVPQDHDQFLALIARLRAVAEQHGDTAFADGLAACLIDASGGEPKCPLAALFLADYADTGRLPKIDDRRARPLRPLSASDPPPYDRRHLFEHLRRALEDKAVVRQDATLVEALRGCDAARRTNEHCPLHGLLTESG
jgi:hypothetical protein